MLLYSFKGKCWLAACCEAYTQAWLISSCFEFKIPLKKSQTCMFHKWKGHCGCKKLVEAARLFYMRKGRAAPNTFLVDSRHWKAVWKPCIVWINWALPVGRWNWITIQELREGFLVCGFKVLQFALEGSSLGGVITGDMKFLTSATNT